LFSILSDSCRIYIVDVAGFAPALVSTSSIARHLTLTISRPNPSPVFNTKLTVYSREGDKDLHLLCTFSESLRISKGASMLYLIR